jgi:hypothetical protein
MINEAGFVQSVAFVVPSLSNPTNVVPINASLILLLSIVGSTMISYFEPVNLVPQFQVGDNKVLL